MSKSTDGVDLNCVPATKTLSNEYLLEKKRLAEAQQKKHKPTRASWAKSLDDDDDVRRDYLNLVTRSVVLHNYKSMGIFVVIVWIQ